MKRIISYLPLLLLCVSCHYFTKTETDNKIAEVNGKILLQSDIEDIFPKGISEEDSLSLLRSYVNNWARKQLVAQTAEQFLNNEEKDVSRELEDYRLSLLIYRYEKEYVEQRLDAVVSDEEITKLYKESPQNFILGKPIAKVVFIKVAEDVPQLKKIQAIYRSKKPEDQEALSHICSEVAEVYTNFDEKWVDAEFLAAKLPLDSRQVEAEWSKGFLTIQSGGYEYFVSFYDTAAAGEQAPIEYEKATITSIIRNNRKQEMLRNLENSIFNDALNHNQLKIYIDNK